MQSAFRLLTWVVRRLLPLRAAVARYGAGQRGNVAITFALATIPIIGFVGAAVDYSRANSMKAELQAALDATALMIARNAASTDSTALQTAAQKYFAALFTRPEASNVKITASYTSSNGSQVLVNGSADIATTLMGVLGFSKLTVSGSSTAKWGNSQLRVALVLDNTGSMGDDGKMTALQTATKNLLSQLKSAATVNGDVYVSIVPFAKDVNAGASNYNGNWIDWTSWNTQNRTCHGFQLGTFCLGSWVAANHNTWNGCVSDRGSASGPSSSNYDQTVTAPKSGVSDSQFPAEQYDSCPAASMGLSYDWTSMNSLVDQMTPAGSTNQPLGLVWGWMSLVGGGPFSVPAMNSNYTYDQIIILLSDGLNTQDRWYGDGSTVSTQVDARMYDSSKSGSGTCANIKTAGITIYTIQVNTGGDPTSTLLQNCASDSSKFFLLTSADQIISTFSAIGTNITKLRIAR